MNKIGVIGWGSLIWDPQNLHIRSGGLLAPTWRKDGPVVMLEFSRVSRDDRLTLVIDETHGRECPALVARSAFADLNDAIRNLMDREGTTKDGVIGYINFRDGRERDASNGSSPCALESIRDWGGHNAFDALIWTGLTSNFEQREHVPFSIDAAVVHLKGLPPAERKAALTYFQKAPAQIRTALREEVARRF